MTDLDSYPIDFVVEAREPASIIHMPELKLHAQAGDIMTRDGTDRYRLTEIPDWWDRQDEMISMDFECLRAPFCGWCEVGDIEPMLPDDLRYPDELLIDDD